MRTQSCSSSMHSEQGARFSEFGLGFRLRVANQRLMPWGLLAGCSDSALVTASRQTSFIFDGANRAGQSRRVSIGRRISDRESMENGMILKVPAPNHPCSCSHALMPRPPLGSDWWQCHCQLLTVSAAAQSASAGSLPGELLGRAGFVWPGSDQVHHVAGTMQS